jgi:hypothetical protein
LNAKSSSPKAARTWDGTGFWGNPRKDWNNQWCWSGDLVPGENDNVTIPAGCPAYPEIDETNACCNNLFVENDEDVDMLDFTSSGILHIHGEFTYETGARMWTHDQGTIVYAGGDDQPVPYTTWGYFNLTINKSANIATLISDAVVWNTLTIVEGAFSVSTNTLWIGSGCEVQDGGTFKAVGTAGNPSVISHTSGSYTFDVKSGGTIDAQSTVFEYMGTGGINIESGAIITSLDGCEFRNGQGGTDDALLQINSAATQTFSNIIPRSSDNFLYGVQNH